MRPAASVPGVDAVRRAVDILTLLKDGPQRIADLANRLNMTRSRVYRLLRSMEYSGLIEQDPFTKQYGLGHLFIELTSNPLVLHQSLSLCARGPLERLRDLSGETVSLQVMSGLERVCLDELPSRHQIRYAIGKGTVSSLHVGAMAKVLLAQLDEAHLAIIVNSIKLDSFTGRTITDRQTLLTEIKETRERGYGVSFGERWSHSAAIAAPVRNYLQPAGISVVGPDFRFADPLSIRKELEKAAEEVARRYEQIPRLRNRVTTLTLFEAEPVVAGEEFDTADPQS